MLIASRGFGKSFMLSLYALLRALLLPNRKVVVVGAAFRQSKVLFEYMETIWRNAPILRDICSDTSGPRRDVDRCVMRINDSTVTCLPLGDGQKIRGQRANDIISDEFASIPRDIFENVVAGFAAVSADPIDNVKRLAAEKRAKEIIDQTEKTKLETLDSVEKNKNEILSNASSMQEESENYSSQRRRDADQYAKEVLFSLEERLSQSLAQIRKGIETMESENISVQDLSQEKIA